MADNVELNYGAGGDVMAAEDLGTHKIQNVKINIGAAGVDGGPVETNNPLPVTTGSELISTTEYINEVVFGNVAGRRIHLMSGRGSPGTVSESTLWQDAALADDNLVTSAGTVFLASTDANDTAAGTGARTVLVEGVDTAGDEQQEIVTLNGTTKVETAKTWHGINRLLVLTAGTSRYNEGTIWCGDGTWTLGVPDTKYNMVYAGDGSSSIGMYVIPAGYEAYIYAVTAVIGSDVDPVQFTIRVYDGAVQRVFARATGVASTNLRVYSDVAITAGSLIRICCKALSGTPTISAYVALLMRDIT